MNKNVLVVAPHCDDEVLGCGGTIPKLTEQGCDVFVAIVTNGHIGAPELFSEEGTKKVRAEAKAAHEKLGVKDTIFLDFPALRLDSVPSYKLSLRLTKLIKELSIDTMYIPHRGDIHVDHTITYETCLVAARPIDNCPVKKVYAYETLSETEWASPFSDEAFVPTVFEDIENYIEKKKDAFRCFTTQIKDPPHPRAIENIVRVSQIRAATVGLNYAEAFMLVREIK